MIAVGVDLEIAVVVFASSPVNVYCRCISVVFEVVGLSTVDIVVFMLVNAKNGLIDLVTQA